MRIDMRTEKKKSTIPRWLLITMLIIFSGLFIFSGYKLFEIISENTKADITYKDIALKYTADTGNTDEAVVLPSSGSKNNPSASSPDEKPAMPAFTIDFAKLTTDFKDAVAWIYIPDTVINYPVVQYSNNAYYLKRLPSGEYNKNGSIFMDYRNNSDFSDFNTIVYGHNMKSGAMFGGLKEFRKQSYYDDHKFLYLLTADEQFLCEIYSVYETSTSGSAYDLIFDNDKAKSQYLLDTIVKSEVESNTSPTTADRILTLSTCVKGNETHRLVMHCIIRDY